MFAEARIDNTIFLLKHSEFRIRKEVLGGEGCLRLPATPVLMGKIKTCSWASHFPSKSNLPTRSSKSHFLFKSGPGGRRGQNRLVHFPCAIGVGQPPGKGCSEGQKSLSWWSEGGRDDSC